MAATSSRYNSVALVLHWLIAALILTNIALAWRFDGLHGFDKDTLVQLHKSIGISILILSLARLGWRLASPPPPLPQDMNAMEKSVARAVHGLFYVVMIGMPLTGWALSSASPLIHIRPITLFGLIPWPAIGALTHLPPAQMTSAHNVATAAHHLLAKLAYGMIVLHVAAAMRHQFLLRDKVLLRMLPGAVR